jgi:Retrotransposon gag protein
MEPELPVLQPHETPQEEAMRQHIHALTTQVQEMQRKMELQDQAASSVSFKPKLKPKAPDQYYGTNRPDVQDWLSQLRLYFRVVGETDPTKMVLFAVSQLRDTALNWWMHMEATGQDRTIINMDAFANAVKNKFEPINPEAKARDQLHKLKQTHRMTVQEYTSSFTNLALRIPTLTDEEKRDRYLRGLLEGRISQEVWLRDPETFDDAVKLAGRVEAAMFRNRPLPSNYRRSNYQYHYQSRDSYRNNHDRPVAMEIGNVGHASQRAQQRMNDEERARFMQEGRCFYCKEKGHRALACPRKKQGNVPSRR